jgi:hypothetical protein
VLIALRVPIGVAMGAVAFVGFWYLRNVKVALSALSIRLSCSPPAGNCPAIPMFLLMGAIAGNSGIGTGSIALPMRGSARCPAGSRSRQLGLRGLRRRVGSSVAALP